MSAEIIELQSLRDLRRQSRASPKCLMSWAQAARLEQLEREASIPTVTTNEEFNALPPGAVFRDPAGNKRRKPA